MKLSTHFRRAARFLSSDIGSIFGIYGALHLVAVISGDHEGETIRRALSAFIDTIGSDMCGTRDAAILALLFAAEIAEDEE